MNHIFIQTTPPYTVVNICDNVTVSCMHKVYSRPPWPREDQRMCDLSESSATTMALMELIELMGISRPWNLKLKI